MRSILLGMVGWMLIAGAGYGQDNKFDTLEDPPHWGADPLGNIFEFGKLNRLDDLGFPRGWDDVSAFKSGHAVALPIPKGVMRLTCPDDGSATSVSTVIELPDGIEFVTVLVRMRGPEVQLGESENAGAAIVYSLLSELGARREFPPVRPIYKFGSLGGWKNYRSTMRVHPNETKLAINAVIVDARGGFEVDNVLIVPSEPGYQSTPQEIQELITAIRTDDAPAITKLIETTPELLEFRGGFMDNGTPLICAAWSNSINVARELVRLGANMEAVDESWGNTPLAWCCWWGNPEVAQVLVDAGAQTKQFAKMAAQCKTNNRYPRGQPEDFDKIVTIIEEAQKARDTTP